MKPLRIALTKGRLEKTTIELLEKIGYNCDEVKNKGRRLILPIGNNDFEVVLAKAADVITYVEHGVCDLGVVGKDTILENGSSFYELLDLGFGKCRFALATKKDSDFYGGYKTKTIASKYPNVTRAFFDDKNMDVRIIKIEGSVELAPLVGLADGIVDIVENRVVGMKSRGVYETPGGTILMEAHQQLEELILDRDTMTVKKDMGNKFAQIVYEGKWFTPLREAVQAFVESTQKYVTGEVKFKLYKGNIIKAGTTSPYSLYSESLASFTTGDLYDHHDAEGFITLFGLPLKVRAMKMAEIEKNK